MTVSRMSAGAPGRRRELNEILRLAVPLAIAQIAQMLMHLTDSVMMGRINAEALAAGGLGASVAFMMIIVAQGLVFSIQPIVAQARGAGDITGYAKAIAAGLVVALVAAVPIILVLAHVDRLLVAIGEPTHIAALALQYETAFVWAVPASLVQAVLRNYLSAIERTRVIMIVSGVAAVANLGLNWVLVFGHLGVPVLGLTGSGMATAIVWWFMTLTWIAYTAWTRLVPAGFWRLSLAQIGQGLGTVLRIGWPIAGTMGVEVGLFCGSSLLMGLFGSAALAAHQICLGIASLVFMVPMAIGQAATVRVGFHVGAGEMRLARTAGYAAMGLGIVFMACSASTLVLFARGVFFLYLDPADPELDAVLALGVKMIAAAAAFQVFDGAQAVASGALRGLKDTRAAMIAAVAGYWGLGMPIGAGLAFGLGVGPSGIWWGFVAGLSTVSVMLILRFRYRVNQIVADPGPMMLAAVTDAA